MTEEPLPTILIVDDDDDYAEAVGHLLARAGYRVSRAASAREALARARRERPDLVIMDVMMEERTSGFFAIQEMRRDPLLAEIPVIVASSIYSELPGFRITPAADWLRHDAFLAKPVDFDELLARVGELVARRAVPELATAGDAR